jgi:hypothetical protein
MFASLEITTFQTAGAVLLTTTVYQYQIPPGHRPAVAEPRDRDGRYNVRKLIFMKTSGCENQKQWLIWWHGRRIVWR